MNWELGFEIKFNFAKHERWISNEMCSDDEWENTSTPGGSTGTQGKTKLH